MPNKYEAFRSLALLLEDGTKIHFLKGIKLLFKRVENLLLGGINGVQHVIHELNSDGFPDLKHLSIASNNGIKYVNSTDLCHPQEVFPNLESLCLYELRNIEMIICCSPVTKASFAKLKTIKVKMCTSLKNLFSAYMVKFLSSLESIDVSECNSLKEIVGIPENSDKEIVEIPENLDKVEFFKLHSLTLQSLPSFTSFYTGPSVSQITEAQTTNGNRRENTMAEDMAPLFGELVEIPNLESLNLSSINIRKIWSNQPCQFRFQNLIKLVVKDCVKLRYLCSVSVASGLRKLKGLFVSGCRMMEKIFSNEGNSTDKVCVFPKLEEIHLSHMNTLTDIWQAEVSADSFSSLISVHIEDCEKVDKIFPSRMEAWFASLDSLKVVRCNSVKVIFEIDNSQHNASGGIDTNLQHIFVNDLPKLKQVWSRDPGGILNFKKLQSIQVSSCDNLRNVFPASVAKDVPKLEHTSVQHCKNMVEIVAWEDGSETNNEPLVFPELMELRLYFLHNMKHFYAGSHPIKCPKLKRLTVMFCGKLKAFPTETSESTNEALFSAEKVSYTYKKNMYLSSYTGFPEGCELINKLWRDKSLRQQNYFLNLKRLTARGCNSLPHVIPSHLLPCFKNLEVLEVQDCSATQVIFNINEIRETKAMGIISFKKLKHMLVEKCGSLKSLFPASVAKDLTSLEALSVTDCRELVEIFSEDENAAEGATEEFVFRRLTSLTLKELPGLKYFYPGLYKLECPVLEELRACHFELLKHKCQEDHPGEQVRIQIEKVIQLDLIPSLKKLSFCIVDTPVTWDRESGLLQAEKQPKFQESDSALLYGILDSVLPSKEKLTLHFCGFLKMFHANRPKADCTRILSHVKGLELRHMYRLESIGLEHSWLQPFPENLQTLQVKWCTGLNN
ncbi:putative disease resistance protein RGA4 [Spatholobus suberectus]|nr:putative disease resistance protein RGA4 [Spatholobus suberectus]